MVKVTRKRSPNYPKISLPVAIEMAEQVYLKAHRAPIDKETAYILMGYSGESGRSLTALSALRKFGLVEGSGENLRISDFALKILEPTSLEERQEAINEAAMRPELYNELIDHHGGRVPSDEVIRAFLIRNKDFSSSGADAFIKAFHATMSLAELPQIKKSALPTKDQTAKNSAKQSQASVKSLSDPSQASVTPSALSFDTHMVGTDHVERTVLTGDTTVDLRFNKAPKYQDFEALKDYIEFRMKRLERQEANEGEEEKPADWASW